MKTKLIAATIAALALTACDVDKTRSGDLPSVDVDVSADAGRLPSYDVDWADVDVGTRTETVTVPKLVVVMEEMEVEVPYMDVDMPDEDGDKTERTIVVEAEVEGQMQELKINKIFAKERRLVVVSSLRSTNQPLEGKRVRVSDRLMLNAPDLDVQHIIVGEKPRGDWNSQYIFVANNSALQERLQGAKEIYSR